VSWTDFVSICGNEL